MSETIARKIKNLENQNIKFKKLLESTLQITNEETVKCLKLRHESTFLKKAVFELENQKKQLKEEFNMYIHDNPVHDVSEENLDMKEILNNALNEVEEELHEVERLKIEDAHLKQIICNLEHEKEILLTDIQLVKEANEENNRLAEENLKLRHELSLLQENCCSNDTSLNSSGEDLVTKLLEVENVMVKFQNELNQSKKPVDNPLNVPTETTIIELRLSSLKKQKENILNDLRTKLLLSANEISHLYANTSDNQLKGLLNELDIHKTVLMSNLGNIKILSEEDHSSNTSCIENCNLICSEPAKTEELTTKSEDIEHNDHSIDSNQIDLSKLSGNTNQEQPSSCSLPSNSSEMIQEIFEMVIDQKCDKVSDCTTEVISEDDMSTFNQQNHELSTVSEEEETQNGALVEQGRLKNEIGRLAKEKELLIQQLDIFSLSSNHSWNVVPNNSSVLEVDVHEQHTRHTLDDATNEIYTTDEQLLEQRIRELEEDNRRIRGDLNSVLEEICSDKEDTDILERGETIIRDSGKTIGDNIM